MQDEDDKIAMIHNLVEDRTQIPARLTTGPLKGGRIAIARGMGVVAMRRAGVRSVRIAEEYGRCAGMITQIAGKYASHIEVQRQMTEILAFVNRAFRPYPVVSLEHIAAAACEVCGCEVADLDTATHRSAVVSARWTAVYLARELTPCSFPEIGKVLSGAESHTTVFNAYRLMAQRIDRGETVIVDGEELDANEFVSSVRRRVMELTEAAACADSSVSAV